MTNEDEFFSYYAQESASERTLQRFMSVKGALERAAVELRARPRPWRVADIGCGAGTQCILWAKDGHQVAGLDINEQLVKLGRQRAASMGLRVDLRIGTAVDLPWEEHSQDVCLCPELLEHVEDWEGCLREMIRVLAPGGLLFISTTNLLCPRQEEFNLPAYSWYPPALKRRYEQLARTSRPDLANHAKYPAVHWFTYFGLRTYLTERGFLCMDRFDVASLTPRGRLGTLALRGVRLTPVTRWIGHVLSPYTLVVAKRMEA